MDVLSIAEKEAGLVAKDWKIASYYDDAESGDWVRAFWDEGTPFRTLFDKMNHSAIVDLACGHGRHSWQMRDWDNDKIIVDVNEENIDACKKRFSGIDRIRIYHNNGMDLSEIGDESQTSLFCYDAMVHFSHLVVYQYLIETFRILKPSGMALFHHSNNPENPGGDYRENVHWRNFMPKGLFIDYAKRVGFSICGQTIIDWCEAEQLDAITLLRKP